MLNVGDLTYIKMSYNGDGGSDLYALVIKIIPTPMSETSDSHCYWMMNVETGEKYQHFLRDDFFINDPKHEYSNVWRARKT